MCGRCANRRDHAASLFQATPAAGLGAARLERRRRVARAVFSGGFDVAAAQGVAKADIHGGSVLDPVCDDGGVGAPLPQIIRNRIKPRLRMIVNCVFANPAPRSFPVFHKTPNPLV